jgi:hypothetical protein
MDTDNLRCNVGQANPAPGIQSLPIKAGATIGFKINGNIVHPGPLLGYMAKVPAGTTAASWSPSGKVVSFSLLLLAVKTLETVIGFRERC